MGVYQTPIVNGSKWSSVQPRAIKDCQATTDAVLVVTLSDSQVISLTDALLTNEVIPGPL